MPLSPGQPWPPAASATAPLPTGADIATDICVVGAGVAGLSVACALAETGRQVVVLDRDGIGAGETSRSTAHLTAFFDGGYAGLEKLHGEEKAQLAAASQARALERIGAWSAGTDVGFEWLDGWLFSAEEGDGAKAICKEAEAAQRAGIAAACVDRAPLPFPTGRSVRFERQAQIDPVAYVAALARRLLAGGGRIFDAAAVSFEDGEPCIVRTAKGPGILARAVVVATDSPVNNRVVIHTKQFSYRTYVLGIELGDAFPAGIFWDTEDPYHYLRVAQRRGRPPLLMVGGEDHRTGSGEHGEHEGDNRYAALEQWARARVPALGPVIKRWSGQVQEPADGLAYIGRNPGDKHTYVATGFSGNGMTYGAVAAELIGDLIRGVPNELENLYAPGRITTLGAAAAFIGDGVAAARGFAALVTPGEVADAAEIAPGTGAVIRRGIHKLAVFRDEDGSLHERSAVCPHLGCVVAWNPAEGTWDCPCHGSRFDTDGAVLHGPAVSPLADPSS